MTDQSRDLIQRLLTVLGEDYLGTALEAEARAYLAAPDGPAVPDGREPASVAYEPSDAELHDLWLELYRFHDGATSGEVATIARAALERWGGRTPAPILLSERQPTEADCDAEGHCWWWHPETHECVACWCYSRGNGTEKLWLPHWALPVPGVEA